MCDYLHLTYPIEFAVNNTTETQKSAYYLDLEIDNGRRLKKKLETNVMTLLFH
jgi:hypothetical protein